MKKRLKRRTSRYITSIGFRRCWQINARACKKSDRAR